MPLCTFSQYEIPIVFYLYTSVLPQHIINVVVAHSQLHYLAFTKTGAYVVRLNGSEEWRDISNDEWSRIQSSSSTSVYNEVSSIPDILPQPYQDANNTLVMSGGEWAVTKEISVGGGCLRKLTPQLISLKKTLITIRSVSSNTCV